MLYSGVSWGATGFEVDTVGPDGGRVLPRMRFAAGRADEMIAYLRGIRGPHAAVVESTNGILDGRMMAAGLEVFRADEDALPRRPAFGSVPAGDVAHAAARDPGALTRLVRTRGTQTGREPLLERWIASAADATAGMSAAGRCLDHGPRERREIALTFDDGPLPPYTGRILDVLERYGVPATFFCVGMNAGAYPEEVRRIRAQGHGLANHTWSHPFLPELTRPELVEQLTRTRDRIAEVSDGPAPTLFRPPYGARTPEVMRWLTEADARVVLWDVAPDDWAMPGADFIADTVLAQARPGSVVLLHDGGGDRTQTVEALPAIVEGLLERDYRFVLVDDMVTAPVG
ncbi:hypothetical protein KNE206_31370 [Kitasatospora sp. NE20-6]|uniref:polysaccharide deacetylase family protein n=1 Tax=Kitasatospora sp. NE20-6 TaxID=2859066 RepID=UPI0034DC1B5F